MRTVAIALVALFLAAGLPAHAAPDRLNVNDECANDPNGLGNGGSCLRFTTGALPGPAKTYTGEYVFLWLGALDCTSGPVCVTTQLPPSRNVVTGMGGIYGLLYADSNGFTGLQRTGKVIGGHFYPADSLLLV